MSKNTFIWIGALALLGLFMYANARAEPGAKEAMQAGALLVDVRTPGEFDAGHLQGARNVPLDELSGRMAELGAKDAPVVVYCRSGKRSARAKQLLVEAGFTRVHDLGAMSNGE